MTRKNRAGPRASSGKRAGKSISRNRKGHSPRVSQSDRYRNEADGQFTAGPSDAADVDSCTVFGSEDFIPIKDAAQSKNGDSVRSEACGIAQTDETHAKPKRRRKQADVLPNGNVSLMYRKAKFMVVNSNTISQTCFAAVPQKSVRDTLLDRYQTITSKDELLRRDKLTAKLK